MRRAVHLFVTTATLAGALMLFASPAGAGTTTLFCDNGTPAQVVLSVFGTSVTVTPWNWGTTGTYGSSKNCALLAGAIRETLYKQFPTLGSSITGGTDLVGISSAENMAIISDPYNFIQSLSVSSSPGSGSIALSRDAPDGQQTAVTFTPLYNLSTVPPAGTRFQISAFMGYRWCPFETTANGTDTSAQYVQSIYNAFSSAGCSLNSEGAGPSSVYFNANVRQYLGFPGVSTLYPRTPVVTDADTLQPPNGAAFLKTSPTTISWTINANYSHWFYGVYFTPDSSPIAQYVSQSFTPGVTSVTLNPPSNATNVWSGIASMIRSEWWVTDGSTKSFALASGCAADITNNFTVQVSSSNYSDGALCTRLTLGNPGSAAVDLRTVVIAELLANPTLETQYANLKDSDGMIPYGCPVYAGLPYKLIRNPLTLPPGGTARVPLDILGDQRFLQQQRLVQLVLRYQF